MAKDQNKTSLYERKTGLKRYNQDFDKDNIFLIKANQKYNVYDFIQANREDTEIQPTLEKYGCIPVQTVDSTTMYQDFTAMSDLRGVLDKKIAAETAFYNLPIEIRREFDHNIDRFVKEGEKYINDRIAKEQTEKEANTNNTNIEGEN